MKLFVFLGASGSGKSTIQHSLPIKFLTNFTTRPLRQGEVEGYHIHQVTRDEFNKLDAEGYIFEKTEYAGNLYGSPVHSIDDMLLNHIPYHATLDLNGTQQMIRKLGKDRVCVIYIKPPNIEVLKERMKLRGDSKEDIETRIKNIYSIKELENEKFADHVIINDKLDESIKDTMDVIINELVNSAKKLIK